LEISGEVTENTSDGAACLNECDLQLPECYNWICS